MPTTNGYFNDSGPTNGSFEGVPNFKVTLSDDVLRDMAVAQILAQPRELFVLWTIGTQFCVSVRDFRRNYSPDWPLESTLDQLDQRGFLLHGADGLLSLTELGQRAVERLGPVEVAEFAHLAAPLPRVAERFEAKEISQAVNKAAQIPAEPSLGALPNEWSLVERPFLEQLRAMGWKYLQGDPDVPDFTERESFREIILKARLRARLREINLDDSGKPWLDDDRINEVMRALENITGSGLVERNENALQLLYDGFAVAGDPAHVAAPSKLIDYIDWRHPERNEFLAVNQFRVEVPGTRRSIRPDIVLFVNGIPLVVIECKNPATADPTAAAIDQLRRYAEERAPPRARRGNRARGQQSALRDQRLCRRHSRLRGAGRRRDRAFSLLL